MAKVVLDVHLADGVDKQEFVNSFDPDTQADWWNMLDSIPCCICMHVEESFVETFRQDPRIISADDRLEVFPAALPSAISTTKIVTASTPSTASNGGDYMPLQMYVDTDHIYPTNPGEKCGKNGTYDDVSTIPNATHTSKWTGRNVDIVTVEVGPISSAYSGDHDTHPDFDDPDNTGTSRVIPMDWNSVAPSITESSNIQVTSNSLFSSHAMGVLSAAGGTICGFAKRSSLRVIYMTGADGTTEVIDAVVAWHNAKPNNPETGVPNPTIMIGEFQYLQDRKQCIPIDYVSSITTPEGTVNRPGSSWGTDFTPFVERNIIPFAVLNPDTTTYEWCVVMPTQFRSSSLQASTDAAWDAGIIFLNAAGNNAGVYVKETERANYSLAVDAATPYSYYTLGGNAVTTATSSVTTWYPFYAYGPHGSEKAIDVAAGYNSEGIPGLDTYTNRGPGIDIVGLGASTFTAYPSQTYADGFRWGMFSGTSCATPTVVGKAACEVEKYYYFNGTWPTPEEVKSILRANGRELVVGIESTDWSGVPTAGGYISNTTGGGLARIYTGLSANGGYSFSDLVETTRIRAHFSDGDANNAEEVKELPLARTNRYKRRPSDNPVKGVVYPRRKLRFTPDVTFLSPRDDLPSST